MADGISAAVPLPAVLSGRCVDDIGGIGDGFYAVVGVFVVVDLLELVVVVVVVVVIVVVVVVVCGDLLPFLIVVVTVHEMMMMVVVVIHSFTGGAVACVDVCVPVFPLIVSFLWH